MPEPTTHRADSRRLLALDVGERRIGVAVSEGRLAVPLVIIEHQSRAADLERVAAIAKEQEVSTVVVGLPVGMSGAEGEQAKRTRRFAEGLARRLAVPIVYQDERLSSAQVAGAAGGRIERSSSSRRPPHTPRTSRPRIDDLAATVILQAYIDGGRAE
jgi:putative holliday junction resolvase